MVTFLVTAEPGNGGCLVFLFCLFRCKDIKNKESLYISICCILTAEIQHREDEILLICERLTHMGGRVVSRLLLHRKTVRKIVLCLGQGKVTASC